MRPLGGNLTAWSGCHVSPFLTSSIPTRVKLPSTLIRFLEAEGAEPAEEGARCHGNTETIRNYWMLDATRWSNATRLIPGHSSSASSQEFGNDFLEALGWKKHQCPLSGERNESGLMGPRKGGGGGDASAGYWPVETTFSIRRFGAVGWNRHLVPTSEFNYQNLSDPNPIRI